MFLTRHFVFLHVPRTGGNFVRALLEQYAPPDWQLQRAADHATVHEIPASHRHLPRLAIVRNPYDWYVSWYHFQQRTRDPFFLEVTANGTLSFRDSMLRLFAAYPSIALGEGPFTQQIRALLGHDLAGVRTGKIENLREDLQRLLAECAPLPPEMVEAIAAMPPQNPSQHGPWPSYYDAELVALIADKDRDALRFFGYSPPVLPTS